MRRMFVLAMMIFSVSVKAQTALPGGYLNHLQQQSLANSTHLKDSTPGKKWFMTKYVGVSTGFSFFNGGNATVFSVPVGIQLNRRLNNNWYAFAGVSAAPAYISLNHSFLSANTNKFTQNNGFLRSNRFDMYSRAEMGLMYINDQKTFSISGSIGIEKSSYPLVPFYPAGTVRPNNFIAPIR